jgi:hypothetical protein
MQRQNRRARELPIHQIKIQVPWPDAYDQYIYLGASGSISCVLQFGSNSDLRSGDGAEIEQSFPFMCRLRCPVDDPDELQMDDDSLGVDTSKWTDVRYGQDEEP